MLEFAAKLAVVTGAFMLVYHLMGGDWCFLLPFACG